MVLADHSCRLSCFLSLDSGHAYALLKPVTLKQVFECSVELQVMGRGKGAWPEQAPLPPVAVTHVQLSMQCVNVTWPMSAHQCSAQGGNIQSMVLPGTVPQSCAVPVIRSSSRGCVTAHHSKHSAKQLLQEPAACRQAWVSRDSFSSPMVLNGDLETKCPSSCWLWRAKQVSLPLISPQ